MMLIDHHTHAYPDDILKDPRAWGERFDEGYWLQLVLGTKDRPSIQGWASQEKMLADMDEAGVQKAILLGCYWEHQSSCNAWNQGIAQWKQQYPERFEFYAAVQAKAGEAAVEGLKKARDLGATGIGEVFHEAQGFRLDSPEWRAVVEFCIEHDWPINMHVTEPVGVPYLGRIESNLADYVALAKEYPEARLVLAHWGGGLLFYELCPSIRESLKNVRYDTAASPLQYDEAIFEAALNLVGKDKILFGSDYPLRLYPAENQEPEMMRFVQCAQQYLNK